MKELPLSRVEIAPVNHPFKKTPFLPVTLKHDDK